MNLLAEIRCLINNKKMLNHPFYQDWMEGKLTTRQLQNYSTQYVPFVESFPRFVSATHSLCESSPARRLLTENLMDEEGLRNSPPHPELWQDFIMGIGASHDPDAAINEKAQALQKTFMDLSRSSYEEGLCALYAYETQIPEIAKAKVEGLKNNYAITDSRTTRFFTVHESADVFHSQACEKLIADIPAEKFEVSLQATQRATTALWDFLTEAHGS